MEKTKGEDYDRNTSNRSPRSRKFKRDNHNRRRSRSPLAISNDTQRNESFLKRGRLFVGNVEESVIQRSDLFNTFSRYGEVLAISMHKGYAFVQMDSEKNANVAINLEDGRKLNGNNLHVEFSSAANKAGARFESISFRSSRSPPVKSRSPLPPHVDHDALEREQRFARIQALERELQQEMTYFDKAVPLDYGHVYTQSSRRSPEPSYPIPPPSYNRSYEQPRSEYTSSREHDRTRSDYYASQRLVTMSPGVTYADYSQRESSSYRESSSHRGPGYGRDWGNTQRSSHTSHPSGGGKHGW